MHPLTNILHLIVSQGRDLGTLITSEPSPARMDKWGKLIGTPFDPFEAAAHMLHRKVACLKCSVVVNARSFILFCFQRRLTLSQRI
jgi:hypothetical protein